MSDRLNQIRIAGRRLRWSDQYGNLSGDRSWALEREDERPLYFVHKVPGKRAGRRGSFEITIASTKKVLGRKRMLAEAKNLAQEHFAKRHHGHVEGHWTSYRKTYKLANMLEELVRKAPKTEKYPGWVPKVCPFCGSERVEIEHPPHTMAFNHQSMTCLHCGEFVYKSRSYCRTDSERAYCGLSMSFRR